MKKLYNYILEMRQRMGKLPFDKELFNNFIQHCIDDGDYEDSPYWEQMKNIIVTQYDEHIWDLFRGWAECYNSDLVRGHLLIDDLYNKLEQMPLDRIKRALGAGSFGAVLDVGNNKVLKLFYNSQLDPKGDAIFYNWCMNNNSSVFPKVYRIGKNWVILEKLKINTPKIKKYFEYIEKKKINGKNIYKWVSDPKCDPNQFDKEAREVYDWCINVKEEFKKIKSNYLEWPGDLFAKNCGERDNGDIIFFDI